MDETNEQRISLVDGAFTLRDKKGVDLVTLAVESQFEVQLRGGWYQVRLESGGYRGLYSVTADGERGRLAISMRARLCEAVPEPVQSEEAREALEQARAIWVGQCVESRVPFAGGFVRGVVREITEQGEVVVVYTPDVSGVLVIATVPVERVEDVLAVVSVMG
jgi:hypothetical protein